MAHTATYTFDYRAVLRVLASPFVAIGNFMVAMGEASSRAKAVEYLNSLSDEDLAKKGLTREDIVRRVFADTGFL